MKILSNPYITKPVNAAISIGFGILTVERFLNVVQVANEVLKCRDPYNVCQMPIFELVKVSATCIATAYTSINFGQKVFENIGCDEKEAGGRRYIPRLLRPAFLGTPERKPMQEISAFHPGEKAIAKQTDDVDKKEI